jgi:hypothetical protein
MQSSVTRNDSYQGLVDMPGAIGVSVVEKSQARVECSSRVDVDPEFGTLLYDSIGERWAAGLQRQRC